MPGTPYTCETGFQIQTLYINTHSVWNSNSLYPNAWFVNSNYLYWDVWRAKFFIHWNAWLWNSNSLYSNAWSFKFFTLTRALTSLFCRDDESCNMSRMMGSSSSTHLLISVPETWACSPMAANTLITTPGFGSGSRSLGISTCHENMVLARKCIYRWVSARKT